MFFAPSTPAVVIDLNQVDNNIRSMVEGLKACGIRHRPHTKTHKSLYFTRRQLELGAAAVTCAKVSEAEVLAHGGVRDIFIAYPIIGNEKLRRLGNLLNISDISTLVNSPEGAMGLSLLGRNTRPIPVLIEIDGGMGRGGVKPYQPALDFALQIKDLPGIRIVGLSYYNGMLSSLNSREAMEAEARRERDELTGTAELLRKNGFKIDVLSGGSSYSSKLPEQIAGITEARAGTYIFNDVSHLFGGTAAEDQCALRVHATVVSVVDDNNAILDAGSKTLSTDLCGKKPGYGYVTELPEAEIWKLNEEHGFLRTPTPHGLKVGSHLSIIPNHCCVVMNLANSALGVRDGQYERTIDIEARGMNQ